MSVTMTDAVAPLRRSPASPSPGDGRSAAAAPVLLALLLLVLGLVFHGAFLLRHWGPVAVLVLALVAAGTRTLPKGPALGLLAALWGFAGWTLLSAAWSSSPEGAVADGATHLLYAALVALPIIGLTGRAPALLAARGLLLAVAALVLGTLVALLASGTDLMLAGRLDEPVGYRNGTAALFALAAVLLLCLAASRAAGVPGRALCFGGGTVALGLAVMTQSRGVLLGFVAGALVAVALGPDRRRRVWAVIAAVAAVTLVSGSLVAPYERFLDDRSQAVAETTRAAEALVLVGALAAGLMVLVALFDRGLRNSPRVLEALGRAGSVALAVLAVGALAGGLAKVGDPFAFAGDKLEEFRSLEATPASGTRLVSTGGQRYDLWRIAVEEWQRAPLTGTGAGGYEAAYYADRATDRNLSSPHSLPLGALAETGLVGFALLLGAMVAVALALRRGWTDADPTRRRWASALLGAATVLVAQTSIDWLWEIPGLTGLALLCLGVAMALVPAPARAAGAPAAGLRVAAALGAALVALLFVADAYTREAREQRGGAAQAQLDAARTAHRLNPLAIAPRYLAAGALERLGRRGDARRELRAALAREPDDFVTMTLLGDLEVRAGRLGQARAWYRRALARNPRDAGLRRLARLRSPGA